MAVSGPVSAASVVSAAGPKFAVIIPARDESGVISDLLESLKLQSVAVAMKDVYVVVESAKDPTVNIAERFGAKVIVRRKVAGRERKGYALAEAVEEILKHKKYDIYFFFDADNRADRNFMKEMLAMYGRGYDIGVGRRLVKNADGAMPVASGLIFTIINEVINRYRAKRGRVVIVSGTGFFLSGKVLNELGTYPFHSLTEDYELSLYATIHGLRTGYCRRAVFYDEQPERYSQYFWQRARWVKGYFEARRLHRSELWGLLRPGTPNLRSVVAAVMGVDLLILLLLLLLVGAVYLIVRGDLVVMNLLGWGLMIYLALAVISYGLLMMEKSYKLSTWRQLAVMLLNPLLLLSYIPCFLVGVVMPSLGWRKIKHGK